jgi:retron-type reverse transcriptase
MKLTSESLEWAIRSLARFGDTDLFPLPVEIRALGADIESAVRTLSEIDLSSHQPGAARRFLVPKDDLSYRQATQLDPLDSVLLTAMIYTFGEHVEKRRRPQLERSVFSYRFAPSADGDFYSGRKAWNDFWSHCYDTSKKYSTILITDIADFYNQVYHHTVENQLIASDWPSQAIKWTLRLLQSTSAKVSRGIPVGPHAAHLLAEASLIPIDNSLSARGLHFGRFVDDIVIFANNEAEAREALYEVAEVLDKQQRLHLQNTKTRILSAADFRKLCRQMIEDRPINDLEKHIVGIIHKHSDGNPYQIVLLSELSDEELRAFSREAVETILTDYLNAIPSDFVRLRWFLRRMAQVGHPAAVEYCLRHFDRLMPAISDLCRYLISVSETGREIAWLDVGETLLTLLDQRLIVANEYFQLSIASLFSRLAQLNHLPKLINRFSTATPLLRREIVLAAATAGHADWLRELKEHFPGMDPWTRRAFLYAASRLPGEERRFFFRTVNQPTELEILLIKHAKGEA